MRTVFKSSLLGLVLLWASLLDVCAESWSQGFKALELPPLDSRVQRDYHPPRPGQPFVFAIPHYVSLTPWNSGQWEEDGNGQLKWRLRVRAKGALSLGLGFGKFRMPQGASLLVRTLDGSKTLGPFSDKDHAAHGQLWTPFVPGDEAELELVLGRGDLARLDLELTAVTQGFRSLSAVLGPAGSLEAAKENAGQPGPCNVDVACPEADLWRDEARSVGLVTVAGTAACSGTLVNNTAQDLRPYFLTAAHCGITQSNAQSVVVYWNYSRPNCGGPENGTLEQFSQGAYFRASMGAKTGSDFTLLELSQMPRPEFFLHWSGWDKREVVPQKAVAIHHPQGAEKKISFEQDPLTIATYEDALPVDQPSLYLKVGGWDMGTTEPGSSGCGLWNEDHRLVGQLWGGSASCFFPDGPDYFGRIWASWSLGGTPTTRLREHLDPISTGQETLDGMDQCSPPQVDFTSSVSTAHVGDTVYFSSAVSGGEPPYTYSWDLNGDGFTDCQEPECAFSYSFPYDGDVILKVYDSAGCPASMRHSIRVEERWPTLQVLSPNGDEMLASGSTFTIRWGAPSNAKLFKLFYSINGGRTWKPVAHVGSALEFVWNVPVLRANKKRCLVKVIAYDSMGQRIAKDQSDGPFSIEVVRLTTIKGGEVLISGEPYPITWITNSTAAPVFGVKVLFKAGATVPWKRIARLEGNPGSFTWVVPKVKKAKSNCWLRVRLLGAQGESLGRDTTDEPFTVSPGLQGPSTPAQ